jgi:hypothetical protein
VSHTTPLRVFTWMCEDFTFLLSRLAFTFVVMVASSSR